MRFEEGSDLYFCDGGENVHILCLKYNLIFIARVRRSTVDMTSSAELHPIPVEAQIWCKVCMHGKERKKVHNITVTPYKTHLTV